MWSVERISDYLGEWGVSVVRSGDTFMFHRPPSLAREVWEHVAEVAKSHIAPQRDAFIAYVQGAGDSIPLYRNLPPDDKRRHDFRRVTNRATLIQEVYGWKPRPVWYSSYDLSTGYLTAEHQAFPVHATAANLEVDVPAWAALSPGGTEPPPHTWKLTDKYGGVFVFGRDGPGRRWLAYNPAKWLPLPSSRPPKGWREYPGFQPPPDWHPPPGWHDREARRREAKAKAERRAWFKRNWGSEKTLPG